MMCSKLLAVLLVSTLSFTACSTLSGAESHENVEKLKTGMSQSEVLHLLGTPDTVVHQNSASDRWVYEYKSDAKKGHNLFVDFQRGSLNRSGELNGREVAAADENRTPGTCTKWVNPEFTQQSLCTQ